MNWHLFETTQKGERRGIERGGKEEGNGGEESAAQACLYPCGGLGEKQLPRLPASLSVSVAMTVLGMMDSCFLMGVDEGGDNVDVKKQTNNNKVCILLQIAS